MKGVAVKLVRFLVAPLVESIVDHQDERSLLEGSEWTGDMNFRTGRFDCGTDPGGFYEDDL